MEIEYNSFTHLYDTHRYGIVLYKNEDDFRLDFTLQVNENCIRNMSKQDLLTICGKILDFTGELEYKVINDNFNYKIDQAIEELKKLRR